VPGRGEIEAFRAPDGEVVQPTGIIADQDGAIWFTSIGNDRLGRVDPASKAVETFSDPAGAIRLPANVYPGPDGRIWFTSLGTDRVGRIDSSAEAPAETIETFTAAGMSKPVAIKAAADDRSGSAFAAPTP
jgi:virginiamycin B lyase